LASGTSFSTNVWIFNNTDLPIKINCTSSYSLAKNLEQKFTELPDLSADWHIYGCEWLPDRVVWYFGNKIIRIIKDKSLIPIHPMTINIGNGIDYAINDLTNNIMRIQYYHYYSLNESNCNQVVNTSNFDFNNALNFSLKKSISLSNSTVPIGVNTTLRATDYVILGKNFLIPSNTEFNIKINPCY
jgi:hypothetical protein